MRRTTTRVLLLTLVLVGSVPSFAQASRPARQTARNFVQYGEIGAISDAQPGVLVRWQMTFETRNLAFNIYRMTQQGLELVNHDLIGGYATRSRVATGYGERYEYYDPSGDLRSVYVIEALSTGGARTTTATFSSKFTDDFAGEAGHPKSYYEALALNTNGHLERGDLKLPKDLARAVNEAVLPPDINVHRWVVAQPGAKIVVKQDGMHRVTRTELENAGFNVNSNSANWRLFMEGNEQAIIIGAGDQYIEFYGRGIDTPESDSRVYYLIVDAATAGKRIDTRVLRPIGGNVISNNYRAVATYEQRINYLASIINGDAENYFGSLVASDPPATISFVLSAIDLEAPTATLNVRIQGLAAGPHTVQVVINGHYIGNMVGNDKENFSASFTIPTAFLVDGTNRLLLAASATGDYSLFDSLTVDHARRYQAQENRVSFYTPGYRKADVGNFTSPNIRVFDTTYDSNTQLLVNFPIVDNGGSYTVKLPSDRAAVMYAVDDSAMLQSPSVTFNGPSTLSNQVNAADVIIISHSATDFMAGAQQWANYRRSAHGGGFRVKVADIVDVYDEFSYGSQSSNAIRDFLTYAEANWEAPSPGYVLLMGDGSYDPRNYLGTGNWALVPTRLVDMLFGESGSDDALVPDLDDDGVPDMAIGRISARTSLDITTTLSKTIGFETPAMWNLEHRGAVCAFDWNNGANFESMCQTLMSHMPPGTPITYVSREHPQAHEQIMAALNDGPYIANWSGHGSAGVWGSPAFFSINHVPLLVNGNEQSIYTMLTCLSGYFIRPVDDSISEALVKAPNGGGVATWASTTETTPDLQLLMGERFYQQIARGDINRLGDLIVDAKAHGLPPHSDVGFSWILLGDPALKVRP